MTLISRSLAKWRDKRKLYLHYRSAYSHQTWQNGDLNLEGLQTTELHAPLITDWFLLNRVTKENHISTTTVFTATKLARMVAYLERRLALKSYDLLITWSCETTW